MSIKEIYEKIDILQKRYESQLHTLHHIGFAHTEIDQFEKKLRDNFNEEKRLLYEKINEINEMNIQEKQTEKLKEKKERKKENE